MHYYLRLFGSSGNLLRVMKFCNVLSCNLERVVKPNLALLQGCGLGDCDIAKLCISTPREEEIAARVEYLRNTFRWTDAEVGMAVSKFPRVLTKSKESLQRRSEFLISEAGLEPVHIAQRSVILGHSLEGRLRPRYYAVKFLKENGLLKRDSSYYTVFKESEKAFKKMFIHPHKEAAPHLEKDYDAACKGETHVLELRLWKGSWV
ncbi:hypothetical protein VPH35_102293 [Triticum aestivum]